MVQHPSTSWYVLGHFSFTNILGPSPDTALPNIVGWLLFRSISEKQAVTANREHIQRALSTVQASARPNCPLYLLLNNCQAIHAQHCRVWLGSVNQSYRSIQFNSVMSTKTKVIWSGLPPKCNGFFCISLHSLWKFTIIRHLSNVWGY